MDAQTNPLLREAKNSFDTDWVEHVHTDGSKYYHNIITAKIILKHTEPLIMMVVLLIT